MDQPGNLFEPQFTYLGNGDNNRLYLEGRIQGERKTLARPKARCQAVGIFKPRVEFGTQAGMKQALVSCQPGPQLEEITFCPQRDPFFQPASHPGWGTGGRGARGCGCSCLELEILFSQ